MTTNKERLSRLDDLMNPLVVKELRQAVNSRALPMACAISLGLAILVLSIWAVSEKSLGGEGFFVAITIFLSFGIFTGILIPTGMRWSRERSTEGLDPIAMTTLTPARIVRGKLFSGLIMTLFLYSMLAPFMVAAYLLRGISMYTIFSTLFYCFLFTLPMLQCSLLLGTARHKQLAAGNVLIFVGLFTLCGPLISVMLRLTGATRFGGITLGWGAFATSVIVALAIWMTLFWATTGIIAPKNSNRMLPLRMMVPALFAAAVAVLYINGMPWKDIGKGVSVAAVIIALAVAFLAGTERHEQTFRVRCELARYPKLRPLLALFSSGFGGGMLLSLLLASCGFCAFAYSGQEGAVGFGAVYACGFAIACGSGFIGWKKRKDEKTILPVAFFVSAILLLAILGLLIEISGVKDPLLYSLCPFFFFDSSKALLPGIPLTVGIVAMLLAAPMIARSFRSNWKSPDARTR